jgi:hypothetical protein
MREPLTALDGIAVVLAALGALVLLALVSVGGAFEAMYADFGLETLPSLTRWTCSPIGPIVLATPSLVSLALGLRARPIATRRMGIVLAFALALAGLVLCYVGLHLPLWQIAGSVSAD